MVETVKERAQTAPTMPQLRKLDLDDIRTAFREGVADFREAPAFGLVFGGLYALGGLAVMATVFALHLSYLAYPLMAGSVLIGPFVAAGLYDVSRELESGRSPTWAGVMRTIFAQRKTQLGWMAFITIFAFIIWMYQVRLLLALFLGFANFGTLDEFVRVLFTTSDGLSFLAVGHLVGAALALGLFSITVISFPLLMDRDLDVVTAMITSVGTVLANPVPMILWGAAIVLLIALGTLPAFLGLAVVLPILGHATWHLYRKAVVQAEEM